MQLTSMHLHFAPYSPYPNPSGPAARHCWPKAPEAALHSYCSSSVQWVPIALGLAQAVKYSSKNTAWGEGAHDNSMLLCNNLYPEGLPMS